MFFNQQYQIITLGPGSPFPSGPLSPSTPGNPGGPYIIGHEPEGGCSYLPPYHD